MIEAYNKAPEDPDMLDAVTAEDGEGGEEEDAENDETVAAEWGQVFPFWIHIPNNLETN